MTTVIRIVQRADAWLIEFNGEYFGPLHSEDAAFTQANLTAVKLLMDDFSSDIRIEGRVAERRPAIAIQTGITGSSQ
jgi:hypothetical protein